MLMVQYKKEKIQNIDIHNIETKAFILYDTTQFFVQFLLEVIFQTTIMQIMKAYEIWKWLWNQTLYLKFRASLNSHSEGI